MKEKLSPEQFQMIRWTAENSLKKAERETFPKKVTKVSFELDLASLAFFYDDTNTQDDFAPLTALSISSTSDQAMASPAPSSSLAQPSGSMSNQDTASSRYSENSREGQFQQPSESDVEVTANLVDTDDGVRFSIPEISEVSD